MELTHSSFRHRQVVVNNISVHVADAGDESNQPILFLHGFPQTWEAFQDIMNLLKDDYHVLAIDLPGVGKSGKIEAPGMSVIADVINSLIFELDLTDLTLVGHDAGGMLTYSFIKHYPDRIAKAVVISTAIPGVEPWEKVKVNPYIWHFAFFNVPGLPEELITGKEHLLFDYFFNTISYRKEKITQQRREHYAEAYRSSDGLKAGLGWYRGFALDEKENSNPRTMDTPLLYVRGEKDPGDINEYLKGFAKNGAIQVKGELIADAGHFVPEENPEELADVLRNFISGDKND